jgi:hypothetical protein
VSKGWWRSADARLAGKIHAGGAYLSCREATGEGVRTWTVKLEASTSACLMYFQYVLLKAGKSMNPPISTTCARPMALSTEKVLIMLKP